MGERVKIRLVSVSQMGGHLSLLSHTHATGCGRIVELRWSLFGSDYLVLEKGCQDYGKLGTWEVSFSFWGEGSCEFCSRKMKMRATLKVGVCSEQ